MAVAEHVYTGAEQRLALRWLARAWDTTGEAVRQMMLAALTCPSLPEPQGTPCACGTCLGCLWDAYRGDLALDDGINGVPGATEAHWSDIEPQLQGPDRTEAARDVIAQRVAGGEDLLINGTGNRR